MRFTISLIASAKLLLKLSHMMVTVARYYVPTRALYQWLLQSMYVIVLLTV